MTVKTRDGNPAHDQVFDEEEDDLPFYPDACLLPKYYIDGTEMDVPPEVCLQLVISYDRPAF